MPVRVVTEGGDPVRIVTEGISDPVRIVTGGASTPVVVIGGGLGPDAPTFVSGEVGTVDSSTVVVTFSTDITAPCGDCGLGFTVLVNAAPDAITACVIVGGNTVRLTLTTAVAFGDTVTISYNSAVGCIMESTGVTDLATFPAQAVTNNTIAWYRQGGAPLPVAAYQPKGAASLAASYVNLANPGTYDAAPGIAPTWASNIGWTFNGATQYLNTGYVPARGACTFLVQFTNATGNTIGHTLLGCAQSGAETCTMALAYYWWGDQCYISNGAAAVDTPGKSSGNLAMAGVGFYRDGVFDSNKGVGSGTNTYSLFIGAMNYLGSATYYGPSSIQAIAIYSSVLNSTLVAAVAAAMAAL